MEFGESLSRTPLIFAVNYFLKENPSEQDSPWLNDKTDKYVWVKWMERRANGELNAIETPVGYIPRYEDLVELFRDRFANDPEKASYTKDAYERQFTIRVPQSLEKLARVGKFYREDVANAPATLFDVLNEERKRLEEARAQFGDQISPFAFA